MLHEPFILNVVWKSTEIFCLEKYLEMEKVLAPCEEVVV